MGLEEDRTAAAQDESRRRARQEASDESALRQALDLCRLGRYRDAEQVCRQAAPSGTPSSAAAVALATALLGQGRVREAAAEAVRVLKQQPTFLPAHRILGKTLILGGRPELAVDVLGRALELHPGDPWLQRLSSEALVAARTDAGRAGQSQPDGVRPEEQTLELSTADGPAPPAGLEGPATVHASQSPFADEQTEPLAADEEQPTSLASRSPLVDEPPGPAEPVPASVEEPSTCLALSSPFADEQTGQPAPEPGPAADEPPTSLALASPFAEEDKTASGVGPLDVAPGGPTPAVPPEETSTVPSTGALGDEPAPGEEGPTVPSVDSPLDETEADDASWPATAEETRPLAPALAEVGETWVAVERDQARLATRRVKESSPSPAADEEQPAAATASRRPVTDWRITAESDERHRRLLEKERRLAGDDPSVEDDAVEDASLPDPVVPGTPPLPEVPTDAPRPRGGTALRYGLGGNRPSSIHIGSGDLEIVSTIGARLPLLTHSLEDSLQRAEAILDLLEDASFPDNIVFAPPPGLSADPGLPTASAELPPLPPPLVPFGEEVTSPVPPELAALLAEDSGYPPRPPLPVPRAALADDGPPTRPVFELAPETPPPAAAGVGEIESQPTQEIEPAPERVPRRNTPAAPRPDAHGARRQTDQPGLFSQRVNYHAAENSGLNKLQERWSRTATARRLSSLGQQLRHRPLVVKLAVPLLLLVLCWGGLFLRLQWHVSQTRAAIDEQRTQLELGSYPAALAAEQLLGRVAVDGGLGRGPLDTLTRWAGGGSAPARLGRLRAEASGELLHAQALIVLRHGASRALPKAGPLPADATPAERRRQATLRLALHDPDGALELLPEGLVAAAGDPVLLRLRAESLGRQGDRGRALTLLATLPVSAWKAEDFVLRGQLLEDQEPTGAMQAYRQALAKSSDCYRAQVRLARLRQREGLLRPEDREQLERLLADARGVSPVDRAMAAAVLAQVARGEGDRARARSDLRRALQLDPSEESYRLQAARLDLEELELPRARKLLEETLQVSPGCRECRSLLAEVDLAMGDGRGALEALGSGVSPSAWTSHLRGRANLLLGRLQEASDHLGTALTQEKDHLESAALLGQVRVLLGNRRGGLEQLQGLARAHPGEPAVALALAVALRQQGSLDQARAYLQEAQRSQPRSFEVLTEICRLEMQAAAGGAARDACSQALRANAWYLPAWLLLGQLHEAEGRLAEAELAYRKVLEHLPGEPAAQLGLLLALIGQDKSAEATRLLAEQGERLGPAAAFARGLLAERAGKTEEALRQLELATAQPPVPSRTYTAQGRVLLSAGREAEARQVLEKAAQGEQGDPGAELLLGDRALEADRPDEAVQHYQTSLGLLGRRLHRVEDEAAALYGLGEAFFRKGRGQLAASRAAFARAAQADGRDGASRLRLGEIAELEGDPVQAVASYREAVRVDPDLVRAYWSLGRLLAERGEKADARRTLQQYLERMPSGGNLAEARLLLERLGP